MIPASWLEQAAARLEGHIRITPLEYDPELNIFLKWETQQITGSFKLRGAMNKVLSLLEWERQRGLVCASAGNHGQGVALAGKESGASVVVFVSDHAVPSKVQAMHDLGAEIRVVEGGYAQAEDAGIKYAEAAEKTWISPYNDGQIIAGQATVGLEILKQTAYSQIGAIVVPVGGGGLIAGIGAAFQTIRNRPKLLGVQSDASPYMHALFKSGSQSQVVERESLADGLAGAVEEGSMTIPLVSQTVDDILLVSEDELAYAIAYAWHRYHQRIEGSAAVALAAVLSSKISDMPAVLVMSGGNIQPETHQNILAKFPDLKFGGGKE